MLKCARMSELNIHWPGPWQTPGENVSFLFSWASSPSILSGRPNGPNRHPFVVLESSFAQTEKSKISSSHDAKNIINFKQELQFKNFNRIFIPSHDSKAFICWHTTSMMMGMFDSIINDLKTELKKIKTTIEDLFTASNNFHQWMIIIQLYRSLWPITLSPENIQLVIFLKIREQPGLSRHPQLEGSALSRYYR